MASKFLRRLRISAIGLLVLLLLGAVVMKLLPYRESPQDQRFYFPVAGTEPIEGVAHEMLWFRAADGERISGLMLRPDRAPKATLLMLHGSGGNAARYVPIARPAVAAGYQVLIVDWRGFGLTKGTPGHLNVLSDSQAVLDQFRARPEVQGKPLALWGLSMGGQVALELARRNPGAFDAIVLEGAVTSFRDIASDSSPKFMRPLLWVLVKGPYNGIDSVRTLDRIPKLFIQSQDDANVPRHRGQALHAAATGRKVLWEPKGDHLSAMTEGPQEYVRRIDELLGVGAAPAR